MIHSRLQHAEVMSRVAGLESLQRTRIASGTAGGFGALTLALNRGSKAKARLTPAGMTTSSLETTF